MIIIDDICFVMWIKNSYHPCVFYEKGFVGWVKVLALWRVIFLTLHLQQQHIIEGDIKLLISAVQREQFHDNEAHAILYYSIKSLGQSSFTFFHFVRICSIAYNEAHKPWLIFNYVTIPTLL